MLGKKILINLRVEIWFEFLLLVDGYWSQMKIIIFFLYWGNKRIIDVKRKEKSNQVGNSKSGLCLSPQITIRRCL